MVGGFTARARGIVVGAHEEARTLEHGSIGCEHILLGLVREENGIPARVFESLDVTVERVRAQVARTVRAGPPAGRDDIRFTSEAKKALELAVREARSLSHYYVGPEHILLALLRAEEGLAGRTLSLLQTDAKRLARAAQAIRDPASRFAPRDSSMLAAFARAYIDSKAASEAGDVARASKLRRRASTIKAIAPAVRGKRPEDAVVARMRALLM